MRHRVYGRILGRTKNQRNSLFRSLVESLILRETIQTTEAKAKAVKGLIDKVVNQAKSPNTKRLVSQILVHKKTLEKLDKEILPKVKGRNSGYTSITKIGKRLGDGAMMVRVSLLLDEISKEPKGSRVKGQESSKEIKDQKSKIKDTNKNVKVDAKKGVSKS